MLIQLYSEIQDILISELYKAYHEERGGHMLERHIGVTASDLKERAKLVKNPCKDEIIAFSRFHGNLTDTLSLIHQCLSENYRSIEKWIGCDCALELIKKFPEAIGDAIVVGTDWRTLFPASCIRVILTSPRRRGRLFCISTAYPAFSLEETDMVWDAKDIWHASRHGTGRTQ